MKLPKLEDTYETFKDPKAKTILLQASMQTNPEQAAVKPTTTDVKSIPVSIPMTGLTSDVIKAHSDVKGHSEGGVVKSGESLLKTSHSR